MLNISTKMAQQLSPEEVKPIKSDSSKHLHLHSFWKLLGNLSQMEVACCVVFLIMGRVKVALYYRNRSDRLTYANPVGRGRATPCHR